MNDHQLEDRLNQAAHQADSFFSRRPDDNLRKLVHKRIVADPRTGRERFLVRWRPVLVTAALVGLVLLAGQIPGLLRPDATGRSVAQQVLTNAYGPAHRVNFFRVKQPDNARQDLLAVIWAPRPDGGWRQVYSSVFEGAGDPQPAATMTLPGDRQQIVLISSLDKSQHYLHYRLLGLNDNQVVTYREQDYVPQGRVEVRPGLLVESRVVPDAPGGGDVTNLIPYHIDENGDLMVREAPLLLMEGQSLVLVGNDRGERVRVKTWGVILQLQGQKGYYASSLGDALLTLTPDDDPSRARKLPIKVIGTSQQNL